MPFTRSHWISPDLTHLLTHTLTLTLSLSHPLSLAATLPATPPSPPRGLPAMSPLPFREEILPLNSDGVISAPSHPPARGCDWTRLDLQHVAPTAPRAQTRSGVPEAS